jgi:hydroxysqualene synthase
LGVGSVECPRMEPVVRRDSEGRLWDARQYCTDLAEKHYENFPVGRWVTAELRPHIHAIYAFARTADDFADESEHEGARLERLALWRTLLHEAARGEAEHPVFVALADTIAKFGVPVDWLDRLIRAFEQDVRQNRHADFESLRSYARNSADPVGRLVLWLHGVREEKLFAWSDAICSALQFANFWQDVAVDWRKNRVYLPVEDMARFAYTESDLAQGIVDNRFRKLMQLEIDRTWKLFREGRPLCDAVDRRLRTELRLVWCGGTRILERIAENDYDVFRRRPKLGTLDKGRLAWRAFRWRRGAA